MISKWETSNPKWNTLLAKAEEFVSFLERGNFFSKPYHGKEDYCITREGTLAINHMTDDDSDVFSIFEDIKKSGLGLPNEWESFSYVDYHLGKNKSFSYWNGNFNGAVEKLIDSRSEIDILRDAMHGDINMIFQCYANNYFPPVWEKIRDVYLHDGFPCGWTSIPPNGNLIVFSNF